MNTNNNKINKWSFGIDNDKLIELVLAGKKTATTSNYDPNELPKIGEKSIILFDNGKEACMIETVNYKVLKFKDIKEDLSNLEGEGPYQKWRIEHINFFKKYNKDFNDETTVVFEIFKLVKDFSKTPDSN